MRADFRAGANLKFEALFDILKIGYFPTNGVITMKFIRPFTVAGMLLIAAALFAQPRIQAIPGTTLELGDYIQGQKAEKIVEIKNVGTDTLRIGDVSASCGCTATLMSKKNLGPGEIGDLSITFNTQHYSGRATKQVFVASNDSSSPKMTITFSATVTAPLVINPQQIMFGNASVDTTILRTMTVTNGLQKGQIKITSVNVDSDVFKVTLMKNELGPGEQTELQVVLHPNKPGSLKADVQLTTDHPNLPVLKFQAFAWVTKKP
jgi:hypothetical protein